VTNTDKLYKLQDEILLNLSDFVSGGNRFPFFLTGGTALVRFHLRSSYRISYDLDFFSTESISEKDIEPIVTFLSRKFEIGLIAKNNKDGIFIYEIKGKNVQIKVDFVNDPFLQIFEPQKLEGTKLLIDSIQAIYFRKVYALIDLYINERPIDRIKDILDLMELSKRYMPLPDFIREFVEIWRQNFESRIEAGLVAGALREIFNLLPYHKEKIEALLSEIYYSNVGYAEIEKWVSEQVRLLKSTM